MLNADVISFKEFVMHEPLPLSKIQEAVLGFLQGRDDAVLFGAQAVNAYVDEPRSTQDVNIISTRAKELAEVLREHLSERFHIAVRTREIKDKGFRIYHVRNEGNTRRGKPKAGTDWRDLGMLLVRFPDLKMTEGEVTKLLRERNASEFAVNFWHEIVEQDLTVDEDDDLSF